MYYAALKGPDPDVLWALTSIEARSQLARILEQAKAGVMKVPAELGVPDAAAATMTLRDFFAAVARASVAQDRAQLAHEPAGARLEVVEEGQRARVFYELGPARCELEVIKEADGWKVASRVCTEGG
ncbi:MAG: hypothetical protein DYH05_04125 [Acidobacteria bacterium ACB1]|nr:hypothetical protein [Acidobacteria bacterium ACB1]